MANEYAEEFAEARKAAEVAADTVLLGLPLDARAVADQAVTAAIDAIENANLRSLLTAMAQRSEIDRLNRDLAATFDEVTRLSGIVEQVREVVNCDR